MIKETTLNKIRTIKGVWNFYRKNPETMKTDPKLYTINHYNHCDKTYSVDSMGNSGYSNEIFLKATTKVFYYVPENILTNKRGVK